MTKSSSTRGIDPQVEAYLRLLQVKGGRQIHELSVEDARAASAAAQMDGCVRMAASIEDHSIPGGPLGPIPIRIVRPDGWESPLPVVMFFHGGGWVIGDKDTYDRLLREIAHTVKAAVVHVEYSRAPEAKYPIANEEAYIATRFIAEHSDSLNVDSSRLALFGDSAGGNMAAAVTLLAKERGGPRIDLQVLFYPVTDADFDTPSYRKFAAGYYRTPKSMEWFWDHYLPDKAARKQPTASPLQASVEQLKGLPAALIVTSEFDLLRDEGEAYARKLIDVGVEVTAVRYLGTIHNFITLNALVDTVAARSAMGLAAWRLRETLHEAGR